MPFCPRGRYNKRMRESLEEPTEGKRRRARFVNRNVCDAQIFHEYTPGRTYIAWYTV
jgi:hypothetical protein